VTPAELRAAGRLGGLAFGGVVSRIEQVHRVIGGRVFGAAWPAGVPARLVHDLLARGAYRAVGTAGQVTGVAGGQVAALLAPGGLPADGGRAGNLALAALNAVAGDRLGPGLAPLAIGMAVRAGGRDVCLTAGEIEAAFPGATPRLAVFVHGLAETEDSWRRRAGECAPYGDRLRAEFGYTPVYVRYNTGQHVSGAGRDLAGLLSALAAAWPRPVQEILLAGHSMGGLVIRGACHYGRESSAGWAAQVRHVFYLGSPHLGAPLARAAGIAGWVLGRVPETAPRPVGVPTPDEPSHCMDQMLGEAAMAAFSYSI